MHVNTVTKSQREEMAGSRRPIFDRRMHIGKRIMHMFSEIVNIFHLQLRGQTLEITAFALPYRQYVDHYVRVKLNYVRVTHMLIHPGNLNL